MEDSILVSTKKILSISSDDPSFDTDVITHINSTFSIINQIGVGPTTSFSIEDDTLKWQDLGLPVDQMNLLRTYVFLRVRMIFDPPTTSYLLAAVNQQIQEYETRLSYMREDAIPIPVPDDSDDEEVEEWERLFVNTWGTAGADQV